MAGCWEPIDWGLVRHVFALVVVFGAAFALSASVTIFNKWTLTDCEELRVKCESAQEG